MLGLVILLVRRHLPESPRRQIMHGRADAAEESIKQIERAVEHSGRSLPAVDESKAIGVFFAIAQCFGALGPVLYGALIGTGDHPVRLFLGYLLGAP